MLWDLVGVSDPSDSQELGAGILNLNNDSEQNSPIKNSQIGLGSSISQNDADDLNSSIDPMRAMTEALMDIKVECKRVKDGCPFTEVCIADIDTHEREHCEYRPVKCDRVGCQL